MASTLLAPAAPAAPSTPPPAARKLFFPSPMRDQPAQPRKKGELMVVGDFASKAREVEQLHRLQTLHASLPETARERLEMIQKISAVWDEAQKQLLLSEQDAIQSVRKGFKKLGVREIDAIYLPEFDKPGDVAQKLLSFSRDVHSVMADPCRVSDRGKKGPTLLVTYPNGAGLRSYVVKYTNPSEIGSTRIYDAFSSCLLDDDRFSSGFFVPQMSRVDLERGFHETETGNQTKLSEDETQAFANSLKKIAAPKDPEDSQVVCMERIKGPNFLDFSYTGYLTFTEQQRHKFFERIGRLAMLDLILGNTDRFIGVYDSDEGYQLDDMLEANLGNIIVVKSHDPEKETFSLYAIDNGIDTQLILNEDARAKYLAFLEKHFKLDDPFTPLADHIITMISQGLTSQLDDIDLSDHKSDGNEKTNLGTVKKQMEAIKKDLSGPAKGALILGLRSMAEWLQTQGVAKLWDTTGKSRNLRSYLERTNPVLLQAVEGRLKGVFK